MTFSNPLLCIPFVERHPNTMFRNDKARPHRAWDVYQFFFWGAQHRANWSLASPGHMGPTTELCVRVQWDQLGKAVNGRTRACWHPSRPGSVPYRGVETFTGESTPTIVPSMHCRYTSCTDWQLRLPNKMSLKKVRLKEIYWLYKEREIIIIFFFYW